MNGDVRTACPIDPAPSPSEPAQPERKAEHLAFRGAVTVCDLRLLLAIVLESGGFRLSFRIGTGNRNAQLD